MLESGSNHVPGRGPAPCRLFFCGEAPGALENARHRPFVGPAGQELERYARSAGLFPTDYYLSNLSKYWPPLAFNGKQLPPSKEDIERDEPELLMELQIVEPEVIVAIGAYASRYFLGPTFNFFVKHGIPHRMLMWDCGHVSYGIAGTSGHNCGGYSRTHRPVTILPVTHPSAGLHSPREQVRIQSDFEQLGRLLRGQIPPHPLVDAHPSPHYERLFDAALGPDRISYMLAGQTLIGIDTEGSIAHPWCVTFSIEPGRAYLVGAGDTDCLAALNAHLNAPGAICTTLLHNAAHDIPVLAVMGITLPAHRSLNADGSLILRDTMSELYLLGNEPKGLKAAGFRFAGMEMESYEELVGEAEYRNAGNYFARIFLEFSCARCSGKGKLPDGEKIRAVDPECVECLGLSRIAGKKGSKWCKCATLSDRCPDCTDGLYLDKPDRELVFDPAKSEFRIKQPQSLGKWVKKRLTRKDDEEGGEEQPDLADSAFDDTAEESESVGVEHFFKPRRDWDALGERSDKVQIEQMIGKMPRTSLSDVDDQERVTAYACRDADATLRISGPIERRLVELALC